VTLAVSVRPEPDTSLPDPGRPAEGSFRVHLDNFDGPFDLLLQLISRHKLDITEVALSQVTDEFIAYIKAAGSAWDLDQTSQFVVVAATLLDLKAARLIPRRRGRGSGGSGLAGGTGSALCPAAAVIAPSSAWPAISRPRWRCRVGDTPATSASSRALPGCYLR
jgi:hypothetical protein